MISPVSPASGAPTRSTSPSGPLAWASTRSIEAWCDMSAICASALVTSTPGAPTSRPRALRTSMPARSNTSSPDRPVSGGHTGGGVPLRAAGCAVPLGVWGGA